MWIPFALRTRARQSPAFQSLAQMNVPQRHCVPDSFCPEGPIGLNDGMVSVQSYWPFVTLHAPAPRAGNNSENPQRTKSFSQRTHLITYLEHIQNCRPRLTPGFLVVRLTHGSAWPSHRGGGRFENNIVHPSFEACCAAPGSQIGELMVGLAVETGGAASGGVISILAPVGTSVEDVDGGLASPAVKEAKGGVVSVVGSKPGGLTCV
jgi:hypothetical protein